MSAEPTLRRGNMLGRAIRASAVNRYLYRLAGRRGDRTLVERVAGAADPRAWLKGYYNGRSGMPFVFPLARADAPATAGVSCARVSRGL